jgi:predicted alpha/beta-hydrolase family hydrolase
VLTHGAGSNCQAPLLMAVAETFADGGFVVLRSDLPYRQARLHGPPLRGEAGRDREGLRDAATALRAAAPGIVRLFLGGHSYGGRQASMLAAESPDIASGVLLLSYPLHPPRKPSELRTAHFPALRTQALFVHGTSDPFASREEIASALKLIPAATSLLSIEGAGHDLLTGPKARSAQNLRNLAQEIREAFLSLKARASNTT